MSQSQWKTIKHEMLGQSLSQAVIAMTLLEGQLVLLCVFAMALSWPMLINRPNVTPLTFNQYKAINSRNAVLIK